MPRKKLTEKEKQEKEELKKKKEEKKKLEMDEIKKEFPISIERKSGEDEKGSYNTFLVKCDFLVRPYERNRTGKYHQIYDPTGKFKTKLKKIIKNELHLPNRIKKEELPTGEVHIFIHYKLKIPKSTTKRNLLTILKGLKKPLIKPDNDNIEKTVFDIFTGILYLDDSQITNNITRKEFGNETKTEIKIKVYKKNIESEGRITRKEDEELCQLKETKTF